MWVPLIVLAVWLVASAFYFVNYRRVHKPVPGLAIGFLVSIALFWAVYLLFHGGPVWARSLIIALWLLAGGGLLIAWRRSREKDATTSYQSGVTREALSTVDELVERLQSLGYTVTADVKYEDHAFSYIAQKACFEVDKLSFVETFFMIERFQSLDEATLSDYGETCGKYAMCHRRIHLPWINILHIADFYPVAVTSSSNDAVVKSTMARKPANPWWSGLGMPIIWDIASGQLCYSQATTEWPDNQGMLWDLMRQRVAEVFSLRD